MKQLSFIALLLFVVSSCEYKADPWYFPAILAVSNHSDEAVDCTYYCDDWNNPDGKEKEYIVIHKGESEIVFSEHNVIYSYDQFYEEVSSRFPNPEIKIYKRGHFGDEEFLLDAVSLDVFIGKEYSEEIPGFDVDLHYGPMRPAKHPAVYITYTFNGMDNE